MACPKRLISNLWIVLVKASRGLKALAVKDLTTVASKDSIAESKSAADSNMWHDASIGPILPSRQVPRCAVDSDVLSSSNSIAEPQHTQLQGIRDGVHGTLILDGKQLEDL